MFRTCVSELCKQVKIVAFVTVYWLSQLKNKFEKSGGDSVRSRIWLGTFLCTFMFVSAYAGVKAPKEKAPLEAIVAVDCTIGESINDALATPAQNLIIEISGMCAEDVVVERTNVTFRGTDPAIDGIMPDPNGLKRNALALRNISNILLENLTLTGAQTALLGINDSFAVALTNCNLEGIDYVRADGQTRRTFAGAIVGTASGSIYFQNTDVNHTGVGLWVTNGSNAMCGGCYMSDVFTALSVTTGAKLDLGDRRLADGSFTRPNNFSAPTVLSVTEQSSVILPTVSAANDVVASGRVLIENNSFASLTKLIGGNVIASGFSNVLLDTATSSVASLSCSSGGDAVCGDATGLGETGCGQCTVPPPPPPAP